jgi:hypothetical protein
MDPAPHLFALRERGAALIIVLMLVVLLTALAVAYLSRTTGDRQVAQSSFHQSKVDQIAASAMDLIIGGLRQEITGPAPTPAPPYVPANNANMLPVRFGTYDALPNLIRRSVQGDGPGGANPIPAPGLPSLASAMNSTIDASANGRSITLARWNRHYLLPKYNTTTNDDIPPSTLTSPLNPNPPVGTGFTPPDWVILTHGDLNNPATTPGGPVAFSAWDPTLADPTNAHYAVGRCAYAIYDEGSLLDANVVGYPSGATPDQIGRKGPVAFADLTQLPYPITNSSSPYQVDTLVGWRNYGATGASNNFPNTAPASQAFAANLQTAGSSTTSPAYLYWQSIINRTAGFTSTSGAVAANGRTDQMFLSRQQLIAYWATPNSNNGTPIANTTQFNVNALQYLGTFLRELNAPSWKPSTPSGSSIDYATLANTPTASTSTAVNRDLLNVLVPGSSTTAAFTRADGTTAFGGDLLIKRRFPLSRINGLADPTFPATAANSTINKGFLVPATAVTVQRDFGLVWNSGSPAGSVSRWDYVGASGSTVQNTIATLDQVAGQNREPNFFELLKAGILSGSVGMGSGSGGPTFVTAEAKYYNTSPATPPTSSDYQIFQIGANIINQWISNNNIPIFFNFGGNELAGIKNLPYLNKLVFKPYWKLKSGKYHFDAWLLPSLWNPHQNAPPASSQNVRIVMTTGKLTATTLNPLMAMTSIPGGATQYMTVDASTFGTSPSAPTAVVDKPNPPGTITESSDVTTPAGGYYGFHLNNSGTDSSTPPGPTTTAGPTFQVDSNNVLPGFQLQVDVTGKGNWKAYQTWNVSQAGTPLVCSPTGLAGVTTVQNPEFVTLDPRTLRFGVWGNAGNQTTPSGTSYVPVTSTLDLGSNAYESITALYPNGSSFSSPTSPKLYLYANNTDTTVHYVDLDTIKRQGDIISGTTTAMSTLANGYLDRPQILSRPFQSMAELGQVFRGQPWKTLDFTTASSPDVGLLDVFTLHESANEAGKASFNTRQTPVLTAVLSQGTKRLTDPTGATVITSAQRDAIVNALVALQPMVRKTDLLAGLAGNATVTGLGNKEARELVMRAFSDAGQTRTWNLLIDVIAQSGRYPPNASTLAGFLVEGEQHYWVHVAIDRFTGQVIDKQIEVVNE